MAKQTAVEWLFEQIPPEWSSSRSAFDAYKQAKEMEKEQIINAYKVGKVEAKNFSISTMTGEKYYNETYGTE
jgi:hypothetical protein